MPAAALRAQSPRPYGDLPGDAERGLPPALGRDARALQAPVGGRHRDLSRDRKSTRLNSSHLGISYAVFCLKKKTQTPNETTNPPTQKKIENQKPPPK